MRLINVNTSTIEEYLGSDIPAYAILSHTWGNAEVDFCEWQSGAPVKTKDGYVKIAAALEQARKDDIKYLWVDTCCIDKRSSAELSEAINSMFAWYRDSEVCYAYLADVQIEQPQLSHQSSSSRGSAFSVSLEQLRNSRWFTRGWTLQELLAPSQVRFFSGAWKCFGTKESLAGMISSITLINVAYLTGRDIRTASIAQRMSWASNRVTKREEDLSYCLMGIFDLNMPLLYGEKDKAFIRLQEEILKKTNDESIFAWWTKDEYGASRKHCGLLATSPRDFSNSATIIVFPEKDHQIKTTPNSVLLQNCLDSALSSSTGRGPFVRLQVRDLERMSSYVCIPVDYIPSLQRYCRRSSERPKSVSPYNMSLFPAWVMSMRLWYIRYQETENVFSVLKERPIFANRYIRPTFDVLVKHSYVPDSIGNPFRTLRSDEDSIGFQGQMHFTGTNATFDPIQQGLRRTDIQEGFVASLKLCIDGQSIDLFIRTTTMGDSHNLCLNRVRVIDKTRSKDIVLCNPRFQWIPIPADANPRLLHQTVFQLKHLKICLSVAKGGPAEVDCAFLINLHAGSRAKDRKFLKFLYIYLWILIFYFLFAGALFWALGKIL
ncbi:HET-domain-containing protein [Fusarium austroafricanum]|uniref:HET-domain-containing protein n=1 Tax=Fusarium austroafricanum TaxID=2364996 RepID=A0A8H4KF45_9HYPO|nr:HET-domain-containing protein [Fusarium austroafricanum]